MKNPDLSGRTALVTGAGRGIGRATALALASCGARVVLMARTGPEIESVAEEIRRSGGQALAVRGDISASDDVRRAVEEAGPVDVLVNSAGVVAPIAPLASADPEAWRENIAINLDGVFLTCRYCLPGMVEREWGRIINISSGAARGSVTGWSAYSAAKAGIEALTKVAAAEVAGSGVRINAVRPGIVDTQMQVEIRSTPEEQFGPDNSARFRRYKEDGLLRDPADPARLVLWLLTPEAGDVNGEVLAIDDPEVAAKIGLEPGGR